MKIKYLGPSESVNVGGFGPHRKGEVKDYPEDMAADLLTSSKKQKFEELKSGSGKKTMSNKKDK